MRLGRERGWAAREAAVWGCSRALGKAGYVGFIGS